jgi:hypothetical protein
MNFKLINAFDEELHHLLYEFFKKSKPMSFCSHPSPSIRSKKINDYIQFLEKAEIKYLIELNSNEQIFISFEKMSDHIKVFFGMNISVPQKDVDRVLNEFYSFLFQQNPECQYIYSSITRKFKLKQYFSWIKRYAKSCKLVVDNDKIAVYWYKQHVE